jgi:hypothetical protein
MIEREIALKYNQGDYTTFKLGERNAHRIKLLEVIPPKLEGNQELNNVMRLHENLINRKVHTGTGHLQIYPKDSENPESIWCLYYVWNDDNYVIHHLYNKDGM